MEIWHHVSFDVDGEVDFKECVERFGIGYRISPSMNPNKIGFGIFDLSESHIGWPEVARMIEKYDSLNLYETTFDEAEIREAAWCRLSCWFEQGYPQPESSWSYKRPTYEGHCPECGVYARQKESFRIKKEPNLGKKQFVTLFWTMSLLTTPGVLAEFAEHGFRGHEVWPALIHKTGLPAETVAQIYVPNFCRAAMIPEDDLPRHACSVCGVTKYEYHKRGYMKFEPSLLDTDLDFVMTNEWFGSGCMAFKEVLVSRRVACLIVDMKWQDAGARLKPVLPLG